MKYVYTSGIIIERIGNTVCLLIDDDEYNTKEIAIKISRYQHRNLKINDSIGILTTTYPFHISFRKIYRIPEYNQEKELQWLNSMLIRKLIFKSNIQKIQILSLYKISCIHNSIGDITNPNRSTASRFIMIFSNGKSPVSINCSREYYKYFCRVIRFMLLQRKMGKG